MLGPRQTITDIIRQQQRWLREQSRRWASLNMPVADAEPEKTDDSEAGLTEIADFGSNPGALRMLVYLPENLPPDAPLVVVLHGCTQSAADFDRACGWSELASQAGFALLLPEQRLANNSKGCFNWFAASDTRRDAGEALSIRQMIDWMLAQPWPQSQARLHRGPVGRRGDGHGDARHLPRDLRRRRDHWRHAVWQRDGRPSGSPGYGWETECSCKGMGRRGPRRFDTPRTLAPGVDLAR